MVESKRRKSSVSNAPKHGTSASSGAPKAELSPRPKPATQAETKGVLDRLPHLPHLHRPTKEEVLAAANGFWSRLRVHFKWLSTRSFRPFNVDDLSAFFSWILVGHVVWILVGTTTFFSLVIFLVNTVFAQEALAGWIGNYLTKSSGITVVFESAVVPKWKDGVISLQNVFVARRPGQTAKVTKGSQITAAAAAAAAAAREEINAPPTEDDDGNYTQFDITIDTVNVTLSFAKWFNGRGLLRDVEMKGIRGVVDRTNVKPSAEYVDPRTWKHTHSPGDFELDSFKMEDLLVTIYQPNNFRPFSVSIFRADLPQLRRQWLFYDFLAANNISGSFDNSLFTIHPRQTHNYTGAQLSQGRDAEGAETQWKKHSRLRIDGLHIDHLNRGVEGPFGWIHEGNVDIVADIMFPSDEGGIVKVMSDVYDRIEATVTSANSRSWNGHGINHTEALTENLTGPKETADSASVESDINQAGHVGMSQSKTFAGPEAVEPTASEHTEDDDRFLIMDLRIHLNGVLAAVPLFTRDISYVNNALIRPIVAYINSKRAFIPVNCRVVKRRSEFDGSWTIYDSGLMDDLGREVYEAFARDVLDDEQLRRKRFKKVGIWTLQLAAQALFVGLAGNIA